MMPKVLAAVLAGSIVSALFGTLPAAAQAKNKKEKARSPPAASPSLDGRVLGYPRTCGHDYFIYSGTGSPVGPYCH